MRINYKVGATHRATEADLKTSAWPCKQRTSGVVRRVSVDSKIRVSPTGEHPRAVRAEFVWQSAFQSDLSKKKRKVHVMEILHSFHSRRDSPSVVSSE